MCWRTSAECRRPSGPATSTREPVDIIGMSAPGGGIVVERGAISPDTAAELIPPETTAPIAGWLSRDAISPDACVIGGCTAGCDGVCIACTACCAAIACAPGQEPCASQLAPLASS